MELKPKAIVFDLDGTLVDSAPQIHADVNVMLASFGLGSLELKEVRSFIGNGVPTLVHRCLAAKRVETQVEHAEALQRLLAIYGKASSKLARPYPNVMAALKRLNTAGVPLGICTNRPQFQTELLLDLLGLKSSFASIVGGDRLSKPKPDPSPLKLCFEELSTDFMDGLFVGDSETDEATALNLGCPFGLFTRGYRRKKATEFAADLVFDDYAQFAFK